MGRQLGVVFVGLFAVAVAAASVYVVTSYPPAPAPYQVAATAAPTTATPIAAPPTPPAAPAGLLLIGPNLARLQAALADATDATIQLAPAGNPEVIADGALERAVSEPGVVILEVRPGVTTTVRTTAAIEAVKDRWPAARVVVVAPFSDKDRKSAAAVQTAADLAEVDFFDPVELAWRLDATSPTLSPTDLAGVAGKLAAAL